MTTNLILLQSVPCTSLTDPINGMISCSLGDDGVPSYEDTCSFTCNTGYNLSGSETKTCQSDGSWNGSNATCRRLRGECYHIASLKILGLKFLWFAKFP